MIGMPEGFVAEPPRTPEGLNDPFAIAFSNKVSAIKNRVLGDRPALGKSSTPWQ